MDTIIIQNNKYIKLWYSETNDGYMYHINNHPYTQKYDDTVTDEDDGGLCTGTHEDAIIMAMDQAGFLDKV